jgi:hydrogenase/urease accessory protein HupE
MKRGVGLALMIALGMFLHASTLMAHELQPAYLELKQTSPTTFSLLWRVPNKDELKGLKPQFPSDCRLDAEPVRLQTADSLIEQSTLTCPSGLYGEEISMDPLSAARIDTLVRIVRADNSTQVGRLTAVSTKLTIENTPNWIEQSGTYLKMGIDHILMGVDHLLFVLGLLLIVDNRWMLTKTITSFTIAHSITLAIATLGFASAPTQPLNAAIALSILFLGPEVVRKERGETSLTIRNPWLVAFAFGLLHGFGFASGLTSLGLSHREIPLALLMFNIGVEIGQLFFVAMILLLERSFKVLLIRWPRWVQWVPAYSVGGLGAYWTIQRTLMILGAI